MRLSKMALVAAACAIALAGCGQTLTPTSAENQALSHVPGATHVITYPLLFPTAASYLPSKVAARVGSPAYIFAMSIGKRLEWVASGSRGAQALPVFPNLKALAAAASRFHLRSAALKDLEILGKGPYHKLPLAIIGVAATTVSGQALASRHLGVAKTGHYLVLGVATLPGQLHGGTLGVANFVFSGTTFRGEYGTIP